MMRAFFLWIVVPVPSDKRTSVERAAFSRARRSTLFLELCVDYTERPAKGNALSINQGQEDTVLTSCV